ncbi:MAG TPA: YeeE/YedE thiosulfate transporter family protein [Candidatus Binatia bacterium]
MQAFLSRERWSPYWVGAGIGILSWVTFAIMGEALGTSTSMVHVAGLLESVFSPQHVSDNAYFTSTFKKDPAIDWQFALVLMLPVGAWIAAKFAGSRRAAHMPAIWRERIGDKRLRRYLWSFAGGAILLFGARLAGGCTSGHGISGGLQLSVSSWVFLGSMFLTGVATALLFYRTTK